MPHVISRDGTSIHYDRAGNGPTLLLVDGALSYRDLGPMEPLAAELAKDLTVVSYDRRGRGESADSQPYAVEREIEDIEALIDEVGGSVSLYGTSSGAVLALKAAAKLGDKVPKLILYAPPLSSGDEAKHEFATYVERLTELLDAGQRGDAVAFFLADMMPADMLEGMRQSPEWSLMEAMAPTLAYDNAVMGDGMLPLDDAKAATMPAMVVTGDSGPDFMHEAADALALAMPNARRETHEDQTHGVSPEALAPVLVPFFKV